MPSPFTNQETPKATTAADSSQNTGSKGARVAVKSAGKIKNNAINTSASKMAKPQILYTLLRWRFWRVVGNSAVPIAQWAIFLGWTIAVDYFL